MLFRELNSKTQTRKACKKMMLMAGVLSAGLASFHFSGNSVHAQESRWINPSGGIFDGLLNWDAGVPGPTDNAIFDLASLYDVELENNAQILSFQQTNGEIFFFGGNTLEATEDSSVDSGILRIGESGSQLSVATSKLFSIGVVGTGELRIEPGARVTSGTSLLGMAAGSTGIATISGANSTWDNSGSMTIGNEGQGTLTVNNGATLSSATGFVARLANSEGFATIDGSDSKWTNVRDLSVGHDGAGTLNIQNGALVTNSEGLVGVNSDSIGTANVTGAGSRWENSDSLTIGIFGKGTLNVVDGGLVRNRHGILGLSSGSEGTASVTGSGSRWENSRELIVGNQAEGNLNISDGGVVTNGAAVLLGAATVGRGTAIVSGANSSWQNSSSLTIADNGLGTMFVESGGLVTSDSGIIGNAVGSRGTATVLRTDSRWENAGSLVIAKSGIGELELNAGGFVSSGITTIGELEDSDGAVQVIGADTKWENLSVVVGGSGIGSMDVSSGGTVSSFSARIGDFASGFGGVGITGAGSRWDLFSGLAVKHGFMTISNGGVVTSGSGVIAGTSGTNSTVTVRGNGSAWDVDNTLIVGQQGTGTLRIENGGRVSDTSGKTGTTSQGSGSVVVTGNGSQWNNSLNFEVGRLAESASTVSIENNGLVTVGGTTIIGQPSSVVLNGGRFEFGTTDRDSYSRISGSSGSLAGGLVFTGYNDINSLDVPGVANLDTREVGVANSGVIFGSGFTSLGLRNQTNGELRTLGGEWARFGGIGNTNAGGINNFGGVVEFENDLSNLNDGFIGGRGQFIVRGGFTNSGVMAFSAGTTDILGDFVNATGGQVVASGNATTTFFDDVKHNGTEIRTASGSATVFLGQLSGAGSFTGTGDVFFEGDLRPGNSPDIVDFGGNVILGSGATTFIELAGTSVGEFDMLRVAGDLQLAGQLGVDLLDGFVLGSNQEFLIADVSGSLFGQFNGLNEGGVVGRFGNRDLFISYSRGDGNDVAFFTAVPEPGSTLFLLFAGIGILSNRSRRT